MNWGKGIALFFSFFVVAMLGMVYIATSNDHDLVADDYYEREVRYQEVINSSLNADKLTEKPQWQVVNQQLEITFPTTNSTEGQVILFRPSDDKLDVAQPLSLNTENKHCIPVAQLSKGLYQLQLSWKANGQNYYIEEEIYI